MEHLVEDLSVALEDSEPGGPANFKINRRWGIKRRTRSAGNLHLCLSKTGDNHSDDSSSSNGDVRMQGSGGRTGKHLASFHQSDSDDMPVRGKQVVPATFLAPEKLESLSKAISCSLESDSLNEHSPARPSLRRKRKLKRMCVDEVPALPCGKRKRPQRLEHPFGEQLRQQGRLRPLSASLAGRLCGEGMEEAGSESSVSWSGDEGHEGDDELTDWAPQSEPGAALDCWGDTEQAREIRAGCRRLRDERPSFSISTGANERVARFLQDGQRSELRLCGAERDKLGQLAALYSLELWLEGAHYLLRKTSRTPCMQPAQRLHAGLAPGHKKIRVYDKYLHP